MFHTRIQDLGATRQSAFGPSPAETQTSTREAVMPGQSDAWPSGTSPGCGGADQKTSFGIAKLLLEHAGTFLEREEAVRAAMDMGMPLNEIEQYLDWLEMMYGSRSAD